MTDVLESIPGPDFDYAALAPILIVLGAALVSVVLEALLPRQKRRNAQLAVVVIAPAVALVLVFALAGTNITTARGALAIDSPACSCRGQPCCWPCWLPSSCSNARPTRPAMPSPPSLGAAGSTEERDFAAEGYLQTEIWPLFLFSVGGMLVFVVSNDLLTMFVALEVMSLLLYLMTGMAAVAASSARRPRQALPVGVLRLRVLPLRRSPGVRLLGTLGFAGIADAMAAVAGPNGLIIAA